MNFVLFSQIAIMYVASAIIKNHPWWNKDFSALYYALNLDLFVRPLGLWVKSFPSLIAPLTAGAYYFEYWGFLIFFLGFISRYWNISRYLLVISFIAFHLMIDYMLNVGTFPYFAMALWTAFLPSHFWNSLAPQIETVKKFFITYQKKFSFNFRKNFALKFMHSLLAVFLLVNLLFWPLADSKIDLWPSTSSKPFFEFTNRWMATYQTWYLFAPYPKVDNVWYEVIGTLSSNRDVDLYRMTYKDHSINADDVRNFYHVEKWRKILLKAETTPLYSNWLTQYYCNHWLDLEQGKFSGESLESVKLVSHNLLTVDRGIASGQRKENVITTLDCSP